MEVTRDIVRDLLPIYLAGEASSDTRAVVEAFLERDKQLRDLVDAAGTYSPPPLEVPPSLELRSLERTRRMLGRKNFWLGFALILSFAPLVIGSLLLADLVFVAGLGGWFVFLNTCKKLAATGLEPPRRWRPRLLWAEVGGLVGFVAGHLIHAQAGLTGSGYPWPKAILMFATSLVAVWLGEKLHQVPSADDLGRPTTLFGK